MYKSIEYVSSNEDNLREISITRSAGLLEWSIMMMKSSNTNVSRDIIETFVFLNDSWHNKVTGEEVSYSIQVELNEIEEDMKYRPQPSKSWK